MSDNVQRSLEVLMHFEGNQLDVEIFRYVYARGEKAGHEPLRALLIDQLTERFGPLPEAARRQIQEAGPEVLAHWGRRAVGEWREVSTNGAATFSSLSCMAGQAELGRRVRPTRRSRGSDGNPGDDLSPEVPASDDDPAGEAPVVNPGPVVAGARSE